MTNYFEKHVLSIAIFLSNSNKLQNFNINYKKSMGGVIVRCRVSDLRNKEVICRSDGVRLGCVDDVLFDTVDAKAVAIVIFGRLKLFGLLGRCDDIVISWDKIVLIGEDIILVDHKVDHRPPKKRKLLGLRIY